MFLFALVQRETCVQALVGFDGVEATSPCKKEEIYIINIKLGDKVASKLMTFEMCDASDSHYKHSVVVLKIN